MVAFCLRVLLVSVLVSPLYAWNANGHRLVVMLASEYIDEEVKAYYEHYNKALDNSKASLSLPAAAAWLDYLRDPALLAKHYVDIPFSVDNTKLAKIDTNNAVEALYEAMRILQSKQASDVEKGFQLRLLLHVMGDIHQPLHAVSQHSKLHPKGDKGGNLFPLGSNRIGNNLHSYWDRGAGWLKDRKNTGLSSKVSLLKKLYPCDLQVKRPNFANWAEESYTLAREAVYPSIKRKQKPSRQYQHRAKEVVQRQLATASCRLAGVLTYLKPNSA